jgi:hypothetical protein
MLLREPIHSMGDWRSFRPGLTTHERGIPKEHMLKIINEGGVKIIKKYNFYCMTSFLKRFLRKINTDGWIYLYFDKCLSQIFSFNIHYHATNKIQRIAPGSVFYVLRKLNI